MIRALALGLVFLVGVGGCSTLDGLLKRDPAKAAATVQSIVKVAQVAHDLAVSRAMIDAEQSAYVQAGINRARNLGTEANVSIAAMMLLQVFGELPVEIVAEAERDVGLTVADALVAGGG